MNSIKRILLYGFLIWLIPFIVGFLMFPIRQSNRPLFESIMPVTAVLTIVFFSLLYFKKLDKNFLNEGITIGVLWFLMSILIDSPLMLFGGPMKMSFLDYMADIGLTYLIYPVVTVGFGLLAENLKK